MVPTRGYSYGQVDYCVMDGGLRLNGRVAVKMGCGLLCEIILRPSELGCIQYVVDKGQNDG